MNARDLVEALFGQPSGLFNQPKGNPAEYVVAAALFDHKTGDVFLGDYHDEARDTADRANVSHSRFEEGFYTNLGNFLTRVEAMALVRSSAQRRNYPHYDDKKLDSYDVLDLDKKFG